MRSYSVDEVGDYLATGFWDEIGSATPPLLGANVSVNISGLSGANQALVKLAMMAWSELGFTFSITTSRSAEILFGDDNWGGYTSWGERGGLPFVNVGPDFSNAYGSAFDGYTYQSWLHEIGHALGLGHTGAYNGTGTYGVDNKFANDSWQMSVMSYFPQDENTAINASFAYVLTPMPGDIAAIEQLYDLKAQANKGNTVYFTDTNATGIHGVIGREIAAGRLTNPVAMTIKDSSGIDTLNFSGMAQAINFDLRPGSINSAFGLRGNIVIERNTMIENVNGSNGHDVIYGQQADNILTGMAGNDLLDGQGGNDNLKGGAGNDTLRGGTRDDILNGGAGADVLDGGSGMDTVRYENVATVVDLEQQSRNSGDATGDRLINIERISGGSANDRFYGDRADNQLFGNGGHDILDGRAGTDMLFGGAGNDTLSGGDGADRLTGGLGADVLKGGEGRDSAHYDGSAVQVDLTYNSRNRGEDAAGDSLQSVEDLSGSRYADRLRGDAQANALSGNDGNDYLDGRHGDDRLDGGNGNDTLIGWAGNDTLVGGAGNDRLVAQYGKDVLSGGAGADDFVFIGGQATISHFQNDVDELVLDRDALGLSGKTVSDVLDRATVSGGNTVFDLGSGHSIVIKGLTNISDLADDLIFA